jgi:hypothetical protein
MSALDDKFSTLSGTGLDLYYTFGDLETNNGVPYDRFGYSTVTSISNNSWTTPSNPSVDRLKSTNSGYAPAGGDRSTLFTTTSSTTARLRNTNTAMLNIFNDSDFVTGFWFKSVSWKTPDYNDGYVIHSVGQASATGGGYAWFYATTPDNLTPTFIFEPGGTGLNVANTSINAGDGAWHFLAVRKIGTRIIAYVDMTQIYDSANYISSDFLYSSNTTNAATSFNIGHTDTYNPSSFMFSNFFTGSSTKFTQAVLNEIYAIGAGITNISHSATPVTATALMTDPSILRGATITATPITASCLSTEPTVVIVANTTTQITTSVTASTLFPSPTIQSSVNISNSAPALTASVVFNSSEIDATTSTSFNSSALTASALMVKTAEIAFAMYANATLVNPRLSVEGGYFAKVMSKNPLVYSNFETSTFTNYGSMPISDVYVGSSVLKQTDSGGSMQLVGNGKSWKFNGNINNSPNRIEITPQDPTLINNLVSSETSIEFWAKSTGPVLHPQAPKTMIRIGRYTIAIGNDSLAVGIYNTKKMYYWAGYDANRYALETYSQDTVPHNHDEDPYYLIREMPNSLTGFMEANPLYRKGYLHYRTTYDPSWAISSDFIKQQDWNHVVLNITGNSTTGAFELYLNGSLAYQVQGIRLDPFPTTEFEYLPYIQIKETGAGSKINDELHNLQFWFNTATKHPADFIIESEFYDAYIGQGVTYIDEFAIYPTKLTGSEVINHYNDIATRSPNVNVYTLPFIANAIVPNHQFRVETNTNIPSTPLTTSSTIVEPTVLAVRNKNVSSDVLNAGATIQSDVNVYYGRTQIADIAIAYVESGAAYPLDSTYYNYVKTNINPYRYVTFDSADATLDYGIDADYSAVPTVIGGTILNPGLAINGKSAKTAGTSYITDGVILKESEWNDSWGTGQNSYHSAFWFERALDDNSTTGLRVLWNLNGYKDNQHVVLYQYQGKLSMQFNNGSGTWIQQDTAALDLFDYNRHFIVIEFDHTNSEHNTVRLYVDAVLKMTVDLGTYTGLTTNAASADSGPNDEANNRPRLSVGCLITPFASTALPVTPANTKLIIDEIYWDKNSITQTQVTNLYNIMPSSIDKNFVATAITATALVVDASKSIEIKKSAPALTASLDIVSPTIRVVFNLIIIATPITANANIVNAQRIDNVNINAGIYFVSASSNGGEAKVTSQADPMIATIILPNKVSVGTNITATHLTNNTLSIWARYLRYEEPSRFANALNFMEEIK